MLLIPDWYDFGKGALLMIYLAICAAVVIATIVASLTLYPFVSFPVIWISEGPL